MEIERAVEFVRAHHRAVLATRRGDGRPQLSPVVVGFDDRGRMAVSTRETAMKCKNVERDRHVSLCVFTDGFFGQWVQVDGTASVERLPDAMEGLVAQYRSVAGEHPDWGDFRAAMERERRVLLVVEPEHAGPDAAG